MFGSTALLMVACRLVQGSKDSDLLQILLHTQCVLPHDHSYHDIHQNAPHQVQCIAWQSEVSSENVRVREHNVGVRGGQEGGDGDSSVNQTQAKGAQERFRRSLVWVGEGQREDRTPGGWRHIFQEPLSQNQPQNPTSPCSPPANRVSLASSM